MIIEYFYFSLTAISVDNGIDLRFIHGNGRALDSGRRHTEPGECFFGAAGCFASIDKILAANWKFESDGVNRSLPLPFDS
jgi:hypothetical protein